MTATPIEAAVRRREGAAVIDLRGDIDGLAERELDVAYSEAVADGGASILLNFAGVNYINSTGIALIVGLLARARKDDRTLMCSGLSDHYREIFEVTRLADFMQLYPDEETAVAGVPASEREGGTQ
jgi:anti-sigma B factor antagonist